MEKNGTGSARRLPPDSKLCVSSARPSTASASSATAPTLKSVTATTEANHDALAPLPSRPAAGIGPEVSLKAAAAVSDLILLIGDRTLLEAEAAASASPGPCPRTSPSVTVQLRAPAEPGRLDTRNSAYVLDILRAAHDRRRRRRMERRRHGARSEKHHHPVRVCPSQATPSSSRFSCGVRRVVMMLTSNARTDAMKVALATTHLARLSEAITGELLDEALDTLNTALARDYGLAEPRHRHGSTRTQVKTASTATRKSTRSRPLWKERAAAIHADGPVRPHGLRARPRDAYDAVCMYHDQGLPVQARGLRRGRQRDARASPTSRHCARHRRTGKADDTSIIPRF